MTSPFVKVMMLVTLCVFQSACGLGYNRMLFMSKTNVGMDVDTKPPTAEVSIARREAVIAPSFEGGKALPVLAGFQFKGGWFSPTLSAMFAGGKAAVIVAKYFDDNETPDNHTAMNSSVCMSKRPGEPGLGIITEDNFDARPFFFATDTTFGLKVAWSGTTEAFPDSLKLGYNRKEFAYAPVFASDAPVPNSSSQPGAAGSVTPGGCKPGEYEIQIPSFIATVDNSQNLTVFSDSTVKFVQFFATGEAANQLARHPMVRKALVQQLVQ